METHTLAKVDLNTLRMYTGVYLFSGLFKMVVTLNNGQLYLQYRPFGDTPQKLLPETETRFFMTSAPFVIEFQREADGSVKEAKGRNGAEELDGEKIADTNP